MKLFLLRPRQDLNEETSPWSPWYDRCFGAVIRAETEKKARKIMNQPIGPKKSPFASYDYEKISGHEGLLWEDPQYTTCEELSQDGARGLVIRDLRSS